MKITMRSQWEKGEKSSNSQLVVLTGRFFKAFKLDLEFLGLRFWHMLTLCPIELV